MAVGGAEAADAVEHSKAAVAPIDVLESRDPYQRTRGEGKVRPVDEADLGREIEDVVLRVLRGNERHPAAHREVRRHAASHTHEKKVGVREVALSLVEHAAGGREEEPGPIRIGKPVLTTLELPPLDRPELLDLRARDRE